MFLTSIDHCYQAQPLYISFLSSIGLIVIFKHIISPLCKWIFIIFLRPPKDLLNYGSWALITGCTDGIGKSFATQLAQKGLNLVLVSRDSNKLEQVANEIRALCPKTQIKIVVLDFLGDIAGGVRLIEEEIDGLDVGVLINNVGISYPLARFVHEVEENVWMNLVKVNIEGTTRVTKAVLRGMVERKKGAIVNIGSGASIVVPSQPLYTFYSATKAYVDQLSRCLYVEYKHHGIDVQCQVPLYVATKMASRVLSTDKSSLFIPSADQYTRSAIRRIGYEPRCTPYWTHSLQWTLSSMVPGPILDAWRLSLGLRRRQESNFS